MLRSRWSSQLTSAVVRGAASIIELSENYAPGGMAAPPVPRNEKGRPRGSALAARDLPLSSAAGDLAIDLAAQKGAGCSAEDGARGALSSGVDRPPGQRARGGADDEPGRPVQIGRAH